MSTLNIRVFAEYWNFENPPGEPFDLARLPKGKQEAATQLFAQR